WPAGTRGSVTFDDDEVTLDLLDSSGMGTFTRVAGDEGGGAEASGGRPAPLRAGPAGSAPSRGSPPTCAARVDQSPSASPGIAYTLAAHLGPGTPQAWRPGSARGQRGADALDVHRVEVRGPPGGAVVFVDD